MLLALLLAASPQTLDLNSHGIYATVRVPEGTKVIGGRDGYVHLQVDDRTFVTVKREHLDHAEELAHQRRFQVVTGDETGKDGDFTLTWNDKLNPPRRWRLHQLDRGHLSCRAGGDDLDRADAVCRSLELKRVGEILRVVALEGPTLEQVDGEWHLRGSFRVERDGLEVPGAKLKLNDVALETTAQAPDTFRLGVTGVAPGRKLRLDWEAGGARGGTTLPCPGDFEVKRPRDGSNDPPGTSEWTRAPGAAEHSVETASWVPDEKVALPGVILGFAGASGGPMSSMVPEKPPYRLTFTAYGPESTDAQTPFLSCKVVHRVYTARPGAGGSERR